MDHLDSYKLISQVYQKQPHHIHNKKQNMEKIYGP